MDIIIKEIKARSIVGRCRIPGFTHSINPYIGCLHGCVYCYARYMAGWTGHQEPWGGFVDVKINAAEMISDNMNNLKDSRIIIGSVTDAYQVLEQKYRITRRILKSLAGWDLEVTIITKSGLITRDIDLLKDMKCAVGFSFCSIEEKIRRIFEPHADNIRNRLKAMEIIKKAGIKTFVFVSPIIPAVTKIKLLFRFIKGSDVYGEALNIKCGNMKSIINAVIQYCPANLADFRRRIFNKVYWVRMREYFEHTAEKYDLVFKGFH